LIEWLAAPLNEPSPSHVMDLVYLLATAGRMRTADQYDSMLREAGLRLQRRLPTQSEVAR
jgi:hypothetical protein